MTAAAGNTQRRDIQILRAIAVLAVLLYHADPDTVASGFLGVDIFFVISGFLITGLILRADGENRFSFGAFYLRRARRLLPALFCTLLFTTLAANWFLTARQWTDYLAQLTGALTFSANFVLPFQVGYFEDAAESRPLLHIWSLSLEEQYYFLLPPLLIYTGLRIRPWLLGSLALASLATCVLLVTFGDEVFGLDARDVAFFSLPTRLWELLAGSLLAWLMLRYPSASVPRWIKLPALGALLILLCVPLDIVHPRLDALLAVALTALLLAGDDAWVGRNPALHPVVKVGDWSYSLYLVHWPLLAFAYLAFLGDVPLGLRYALIVAALPLSVLQYRLVEQPLRRSGTGIRGLSRYLGVAAAVMALLCLPPILERSRPADTVVDWEDLRRKNVGLSRLCVQKREFQARGKCRTRHLPQTAVFGDSYAMHLIEGLRNNPEIESLVQITRSSCPPAADLAPLNRSPGFARACLRFNADAAQWIRDWESVSRVILGSTFGQLGSSWERAYTGEGVRKHSREDAIADLATLVGSFQQAGKQVLLVSPTPQGTFDVGDCLERRASGALVLGQADCDIDYADVRRRQHLVLEGLREVSARTGARVLWLTEILCAGERCRTTLDGVPLYRDKGHLSYSGSTALLADLPLW